MKILSRQMFILILFVITVSPEANASDSYTNWNDLVFGLIVPKTNFVAESSIPAIIVISNATSQYHLIRYQGHLCDCGFGTFLITEKKSGKVVKCIISDNDASSSAFGLYLHQSQTFSFDLKTGYGITKPGDYLVQASGWFPLQEPPNGQLTNIITPPIIISLSPKAETNAPPK